jgi:hypothetical protein
MDDTSTLPTMVESQRVSVEHYIKFTFSFCNLQDKQVMNLEFPMNIIGYTPSIVSNHFNQINLLETTNSCNSSIADEIDSAIDVLSFKSSCSSSNYLLTRFQEFA